MVRKTRILLAATAATLSFHAPATAQEGVDDGCDVVTVVSRHAGVPQRYHLRSGATIQGSHRGAEREWLLLHTNGRVLAIDPTDVVQIDTAHSTPVEGFAVGWVLGGLIPDRLTPVIPGIPPRLAARVAAGTLGGVVGAGRKWSEVCRVPDMDLVTASEIPTAKKAPHSREARCQPGTRQGDPTNQSA